MSDINTPQGSNQDLSTILKVVSFCIPLVGGILWLVKKDNEPVAAKSAGKMALIGLAIGVVINIVSILAGGLLSM